MINIKKQIQINNLKLSIFKINDFVWLYIYNKNYSIFLKIKSSSFKIKSTNTVVVLNKNVCLKDMFILDKKLYNFVKQIDTYLYVKIKFSGKGYKIKKNNNNNLLLLFNRAHITNIWWKNIIIKKLKKYKIYIRYTQINIHIIQRIINTRIINIFTKKGLRKSKQILFKKKGKK